MNWKRFFLNIAGVALGGFGTAVASAGSTGSLSGKSMAGAILLPVVGNLVGLFQQPPHDGAPQG